MALAAIDVEMFVTYFMALAVNSRNQLAARMTTPHVRSDRCLVERRYEDSQPHCQTKASQFSNRITMRSSMAFSSFLVLLVSLFQEISSHGYMLKPISRNWAAHIYGAGSSSNRDDVPIKTWSYPGLENGGQTFGACGAIGLGRDVRFTSPSDWVAPDGTSLPFQAYEIYNEGDIIDVYSIIRANHRGHIEMYACADITNATDECFRNNPLEFVEDPLYGAEKDSNSNYANRAYLAPGGSPRLTPYYDNGLQGDILLQWYWITANGCRAPGYESYYTMQTIFTKPQGSLTNTCTLPYADCSREPGYEDICRDPQIFRNCAEVTILPNGPPAPTPEPSARPSLHPSVSHTPAAQPSEPPSVLPTISTMPSLNPSLSPTSTPNSAPPCCSADHKDCLVFNDSCHLSESNCLQQCNGIWLTGGALSNCIAKDQQGCSSANVCCPGLQCNQEGANASCRK